MSASAHPRIRYTKGPDALGFGGVNLKRGEWAGKDDGVTNDLAWEWAASPGRVEEIGAQAEGCHAPAAKGKRAAPPAAEPMPAPASTPSINPTSSQE